MKRQVKEWVTAIHEHRIPISAWHSLHHHDLWHDLVLPHARVRNVRTRGTTEEFFPPRVLAWIEYEYAVFEELDAGEFLHQRFE